MDLQQLDLAILGCQHMLVVSLDSMLTPMGKPPPLAVRLEKALPFRR